MKQLLKKLNLKYQSLEWYQKAMIHRSYLNEANKPKIESNERLEFLGDAVLELAVTKFLFNQYPNKKEGYLTMLRSKIVQTATLAKVSQNLGLDKHLKLSKGEKIAKGRKNPSILADTFEAFLGAVYQDLGWEKAKSFVKKQVLKNYQKLIKDIQITDFKSQLQERVQAKGLPTPSYQIVKSWGPDHKRQFKSQVLVENQAYGEGIGRNKQSAEQAAAAQALEKFR